MRFKLIHIIELTFWVALLLAMRQPVLGFMYWAVWSGWCPRPEYEARYAGFEPYAIWVLCWVELLMIRLWVGAYFWGLYDHEYEERNGT